MGIFWNRIFIWAVWHIFGAYAVDTLTTLPPKLANLLKRTNGTHIRDILNNSRRILNGGPSDTKPYMVYLKLPTSSSKYQEYKRWLCGGIIIHDDYILTSAACIEDVGHFYVVSGTARFAFEDDRHNNICIKNGAKKAIWKCIPRNYIFDGHENDNIRWLNNDIAVVKTEDEFDFTRRIRGCDYIPKPVCYNNQSLSLEDPGTEASVLGWGSTDRYNDWINARRDGEGTTLTAAGVIVMPKQLCKKRWGNRYYNIIDNYMICTNDLSSELSEICLEKYVECHEIGGDSEERRFLEYPSRNELVQYPYESRRQLRSVSGGGFCENDHGGPLVVGKGIDTIAIGIISACLVKEKSNQCYGPFLYTSIYKNRNLINCALFKDIGHDCGKLFRSSVTHVEVEMSWADHPDGPAKNEKETSQKKQPIEPKIEPNIIEPNIIEPTQTETEEVPLGLILRTGPNMDDEEEAEKKIMETIRLHQSLHSSSVTEENYDAATEITKAFILKANQSNSINSSVLKLTSEDGNDKSVVQLDYTVTNGNNNNTLNVNDNSTLNVIINNTLNDSYNNTLNVGKNNTLKDSNNNNSTLNVILSENSLDVNINNTLNISNNNTLNVSNNNTLNVSHNNTLNVNNNSTFTVNHNDTTSTSVRVVEILRSDNITTTLTPAVSETVSSAQAASISSKAVL